MNMLYFADQSRQRGRETRMVNFRNIMKKIGNFQVQYSAFLLLAGLVLVGGCANNSTQPNSPSAVATSSPSATKQTASSTAGTKININTAPIAELDKLELPGTKPSLSERIQGARPYKTRKDLVTKKAISQEEFNLIKNLITTGDKK